MAKKEIYSTGIMGLIERACKSVPIPEKLDKKMEQAYYRYGEIVHGDNNGTGKGMYYFKGSEWDSSGITKAGLKRYKKEFGKDFKFSSWEKKQLKKEGIKF